MLLLCTSLCADTSQSLRDAEIVLLRHNQIAGAGSPAKTLLSMLQSAPDTSQQG